MMAMSVRTNFLRGQRLFPWHGPFLAGDRADEYAGLHATGAGRSALLNYIFFVRTFDLALGNRLCARPGTGRRIAGSDRQTEREADGYLRTRHLFTRRFPAEVLPRVSISS